MALGNQRRSVTPVRYSHLVIQSLEKPSTWEPLRGCRSRILRNTLIVHKASADARLAADGFMACGTSQQANTGRIRPPATGPEAAYDQIAELREVFVISPNWTWPSAAPVNARNLAPGTPSGMGALDRVAPIAQAVALDRYHRRLSFLVRYSSRMQTTVLPRPWLFSKS